MRPVARLLGLLASGWLVLAASSSHASAQERETPPRFEVASVKVNPSGGTSSSNDFSGANVVFRNYTLGGIVQTAFSVERLNLEAPDWIYDPRFDITAKVADGTASLEQRRRMLQTLLVERFGLTYHREVKQRSGFALVVGKNGAKIQPVEDVGGHNNDNRPGRMERLRTTIPDFASVIASVLRQPVTDETKLPGRYNILLTYAPDRGADAQLDGPSIFTAVEEQLGLRLEPRKIPVDTLVIDSVLKVPTEN